MEGQTKPNNATPSNELPTSHTLNVKHIVIGIILFTLTLGLGFFLGRYTYPHEEPVVHKDDFPLISPSQGVLSPTQYLQKGNKLYVSQKHGFSLVYPEDSGMKVEESEDGSVSFILKGPTQKEATEFYDGIGFTFSSGRYDSSKYDANRQILRQFVEEKIKQATVNGELIKPIDEYIYDGHLGYTYRIRGLGEFSYIYIATEGNKYLEIIDATSDPGSGLLYKQASQILASLRILD